MDELAGVLNRQKQMLEVLVYRVEILRHLLSKGETRFLGFATAEVDHAAAMLRAAEQDRTDLVARFALERGLDPASLSLKALSEQAGPYAPMFDRLRSEFLSLTDELEALVRASKVLAGRGIAEVDRILSMLSGGGTPNAALTYGPSADRRRPRALGRSYEAVL